jgi:translation elongation factor EF-1alpha
MIKKLTLPSYDDMYYEEIKRELDMLLKMTEANVDFRYAQNRRGI